MSETFWKCLREAYSSIQKMEVRFNLLILKKLVAFWMLTTLLPTLAFYEYVYSTDSMNITYKEDLLVQSYNLLPESLKAWFELYPYSLTILIVVLAVLQIISRKSSVVRSFLLFISFNFHLCLTSDIASGATAIVANISAFIFFLDIVLKTSKELILVNFIYFAMKLQMVIVYLVAGLVKIFSDVWMGGSASYYIFYNSRYSKAIPLLEPFKDYDYFWKILSYTPIIFLVLFPVLIFTRFKNVVVIMSFVFHSLIAFFMGLKEFMIFPLLDVVIFYSADDLKKIVFKISEYFMIGFQKTIKSSQGKENSESLQYRP